ncbi:Uma2 family endonuclease [Nonomuraea sp. 3-1Str]|uniref:Uma2 family endonuclease n=1 Tax=Nonomuraea sp. 3-1Str TaxID=2929801 RepID=UPI002856F2B8|nr:Uma2 family endonuclease [Nonomuraea sp. 3-1Str]MDR8412204.1 Uma2 family endonuclease [Nonomuraea sp. 3-1Str]
MTAEAVSLEMEPPSLPDWITPPRGGFKAEDLDHIPDLPAHTELIDGSLVFVSPQRDFHTSMLFLLHSELRRAAPADCRVRREMSVILGPEQRPEPDLIVIPSAVTQLDATFYYGKDVILAVEVVSPESRARDRERKPVLYAKAGIPHFWRVEEAKEKPIVYVYEFDKVTDSYVATGIFRDRLKLTVPFDIDIDLTEIERI